ncbi:unnamed protein product [Schistosoma curassoni]|uniref:Uncharacterized protein n=1 Tax=Schistosoma curassoni TaxID=6186 RepID=A0A183JSU9_9TREM|nr:unnamed protein product [Schistosoma curassoni]
MQQSIAWVCLVMDQVYHISQQKQLILLQL